MSRMADFKKSKTKSLPEDVRDFIDSMLEWNRRQKEALDASRSAVEKMFHGKTLNKRDRQTLVAVVGLSPEEVDELHARDMDDEMEKRLERWGAEPYTFGYVDTDDGRVRIDVRGEDVSFVTEDDEDFE